MIYRLFFRACVIVPLLAAVPAHATKDVSSPTVSEGKLKFEARYGFEQDDRNSRDERFRQVYLFEYGVTKWWSTRINGRINKLDEETTDYTATEWENKFQLFHEKEDGFNGAFKLVYSHADNEGDADSIEFKTMAERKFGAVKLRGNLGLEWEVGDDAEDDAVFAAALQALVPVNDQVSAGLEWFGLFGEIDDIPGFSDGQEHQFGPVITVKATDALAFEGGYLFGVSRQATDGLFKFFVKYTF